MVLTHSMVALRGNYAVFCLPKINMNEVDIMSKPMNERDTYLCTRPTLALKLMQAGFVGLKAPNPYDSKRPAWVFGGDMNRINEIVSDYYNNLKPKKGVK